ncbi:MAG: type II CAAX prenyl endopeptidase Rce1 family protein [Bacteroidales bacterium]
MNNIRILLYYNKIKNYNIITSITRNPFLLILTFILLLVISNTIITGVLFLIGQLDAGPQFYHELNFAEQIFWGVVFGPIVETIIFHFLLMELLLFIFKKTKNQEYWVVLISAIIFSLIHYYSIQYRIYSFFAGIIFSSAYLVARKNKMLPFAVVFIIHSVYNLISFSYIYFLK